MTLEALQQAVGTIFGHVQVNGIATGLSFALEVVGIALLLGVIVIGGGFLLVRAAKSVGNMSPAGFVAFIVGLAVALILVGIALP